MASIRDTWRVPMECPQCGEELRVSLYDLFRGEARCPDCRSLWGGFGRDELEALKATVEKEFRMADDGDGTEQSSGGSN